MANRLNTDIRNGRLIVPPEFGRGYCAGFIFNPHIRLFIMNYELDRELVIENPVEEPAGRMILFKFRHIFPFSSSVGSTDSRPATPSVLIATNNLRIGEAFPVHSNTATINIEVEAEYLRGLFPDPELSPLLSGLLSQDQPLLFEQVVYPSLQRIVEELTGERIDPLFERFLLRIKAEELVCRLLMELAQRGEKQLYGLNEEDIRAVYEVKRSMLERLSEPPRIRQLAARAHMSPSKLNRLFGQVFGASVFHYYQAHRMKEAARLLKEELLSVSDTGYRLGFTNLSHFSRIFKRHIGMKPKQFSRT
ncbi:MAG: AraC family transcriptional regulator [Rikenellaceae bacterium]|nr:AraC family transcriptional regulator [Rikenellaceae bacterium]